ncbi:MAG TPA: hypothetical protein VND19_21795 [Acetobacteraceae bacterium]|nr:hypothetical protein [Acetobacteraceae bacterium]
MEGVSRWNRIIRGGVFAGALEAAVRGAVDDDHINPAGMVNELYGAMQAGHGREPVGRILDRLVRHSNFHFAREEKLFAPPGRPAARTAGCVPPSRDGNRLLCPRVTE